MKLVSWNVNGINSAVKKGLLKFMAEEAADMYCFQEVKVSPEKIDAAARGIPGYTPYFLHSQRKGYSGVLTYSKLKPISVTEGIGNSEMDSEGRVLTLEFEKYFLVNAYFPNSNHELSRLGFKLEFNSEFLKFCEKLRKKKPLVICGDFNVAHTELDIKNAKENEHNAGFTVEERNWFTSFLSAGYIDTYREFVKEGGHYTWWSFRFSARQRNIGWRIDYFVVSKELKKNLADAGILEKVTGSDHCPIELTLRL